MQDSLAFAIKMEKDGYQFYTESAQKVKDPAAQFMLNSLAGDEKRHETVLLSIQSGRPKLITSNVFSQIKNVFQQLTEAGTTFVDEDDTLRDVLQKGIQAERKSIELYREMGQQSSDQTEKKLLHRLQLEEEKHENLLAVTLEYLDQPHMVLETSEFLFYDYDSTP